jgi:hypothetical protein
LREKSGLGGSSGSSGFAVETMPSFVPYNLLTQHSIPDKSIADCVEALIGAYLVTLLETFFSASLRLLEKSFSIRH